MEITACFDLLICFTNQPLKPVIDYREITAIDLQVLSCAKIYRLVGYCGVSQ